MFEFYHYRNKKVRKRKLLKALIICQVVRSITNHIFLSSYLQRAVMAKIQLLGEMDDLSLSGFGQPSPRHGLQLLFWFAKRFIHFDNNNQIIMKYNPSDGRFGFHKFQNRFESFQGGRLLPNQRSPYYEVGNLHPLEAQQLPKYVKEKFTGHIDGSNTDRLIIGLNSNGEINKVYVTQHENGRNFSHGHTYQISEDLLHEIQNTSNCKSFLEQVLGTGKSKPKKKRRQINDYVAVDMDSNPPIENYYVGDDTSEYSIPIEKKSCCPCCTIL